MSLRQMPPIMQTVLPLFVALQGCRDAAVLREQAQTCIQGPNSSKRLMSKQMEQRFLRHILQGLKE